ncbi:MAG: hypothetical protein A2Y40_05520 [Candidatus Margulisbacteria bacterium GWF2_35_9]|nr:MAG: hypothetical protein A2Y40_05520 [Candidatus Margulisbacteria bacterium GWF2_35_9]
MELGIHAPSNLNKNPLKPVDQQLEEKITDYLKSSSRSVHNPTEFKTSVALLNSKGMDVKSFCKQILNSTNTNDLNAITNILKQTGQLENEPIPQESQTKQNLIMQNQTNANIPKSTINENPNLLDQLKIVQTSATDQLLAGEIISLIKKGSIQEALTKTNGSDVIIDKTLSLLKKTNMLNQQQIQSIIAFINGVLANFPSLNPSIMESLKEKLDKLKKELEHIEKSEESIDEKHLSESAEAFVEPFMDLIDNLHQHEGNMPKDVANALSELLQKIEDTGDDDGKQ